MKVLELMSPERLQSATAALADDSTFAERVAWWLRGAHASEHWFQFEWAYRFQQEMPPEWSVICEVQRVDVAIRELGMHSGPPVAGVEIKWYGNWWVDETYFHGRPVYPGESITAKVEAPRASGQLFYQFDPLFHDNSVFSLHPRSDTIRLGN